MQNSKIEWTTHTFNPWVGCTKVSPGCANCYAETLMDHRYHRVKWGKGQLRSRTGAANWKEPLRWNAEEDRKMVSHAEFASPDRPRVFCASLSDWLDDEVPIEWLADLLNLVQRTPNLDWLLLTKRPENWRNRLEMVRDYVWKGDPETIHPHLHTIGFFVDQWLCGHPPANIWIGTSVEDQTRADERIPKLLEIPARVRFLSCEPLLGPVDLRSAFTPLNIDSTLPISGEPDIHWVIAGGESGPGARPMHPDWARGLRDQCAAAGVPFLFKQWGDWHPGAPDCPSPELSRILEPGVIVGRFGKKMTGRRLDGVEHNGFPVSHSILQ